MSPVFAVSSRARSHFKRVAVACGAAALLAAAAILPASAATIVTTTGRIGAISLVDTSANPGVTCKFTLPAISLNNPQPALNSIILSGPTVGPIVESAADGVIFPALVSAEFRVYQQLTVNGEPAGSRLVLSAVEQVATNYSGAKVPDHTFDAHTLPSGRYTAQIVVTYKSIDQSVTYGSRTIGYDFYKSTVSQYSLVLGRFVDQVTGVCSAC